MQHCTKKSGKNSPTARSYHLSLRASSLLGTRRALSNVSKNNQDNDDWASVSGARIWNGAVWNMIKKKKPDD